MFVFRKWAAATNLVTNGGFETNTTGAPGVISGTASLTRSTAQAKFGSASGLVDVTGDGAVLLQGLYETLSGDTTGLVRTASGWVYAAGAAVGRSVFLTAFENGGAGGANGTSGATLVLVAGWNELPPATHTFAAADRTESLYRMTFSDSLTGDDFYVDGIQFESGSIATPYIETDGATAARSAGPVIQHVEDIIIPVGQVT